MNNLISTKLAKVSALVVFLVALAINIKVTLDNPFLMLTEGVLAQISDSDGSITSSSPKQEEESSDVRRGYSWGKQSDLKSTSLTKTETTNSEVESRVSFSLTRGISISISGKIKTETSESETNTYNWINCCIPSNPGSACNFKSAHRNCVIN